MSPYLEGVLKLLKGKVGVLVDTSGCGLENSHIDLLRKYNMGIRVSLDAERPKANEAERPAECSSGPYTLEMALSAICRCLDAELPVTVQSVATKRTANDLPVLGDKLFRLGVRSWRVFKVVPACHNIKLYKRLVGRHGLYPYVFRQLISLHQRYWH